MQGMSGEIQGHETKPGTGSAVSSTSQCPSLVQALWGVLYLNSFSHLFSHYRTLILLSLWEPREGGREKVKCKI